MTLPEEAANHLHQWLGDRWTAQPLFGDASVRAYYRIGTPDSSTYILAYYPPEVREQLRRFLDAYAAVSPHVRLAEVLQTSDVAVLQEDLGDRTLFDVLHRNRDEGIRLYREAIEQLVAFHQATANVNPSFSSEFFFREMEMALEFYVEKLMGADAVPLKPILKTLAENITHHPYVLCHRDYHGQNLHIKNDRVYIIDYQDLRMGPDTYDMASLLRDRGVARILGDETELALLDEYGQRTTGIRQRFHETLLQRSIKILGTFSRQPIERNRMHYLDFIPPTLESIARCLDELPEFAALREIFPFDFDVDRARLRAADLYGRQ